MKTLLITKLEQIHDFRRPQGRRYPLPLILVITIMAGISQIFSTRGIADFIVRHRAALIKALNVPKDCLPSRSPLKSVMKNLDFDELAEIFKQWILENDLMQKGEWISIDGKSIKSTLSNYNSSDQNFVSIVSAFTHSSHVALMSKSYQNKKSSEIPVVENLIKVLGLEGVTFTLDALHTKKKHLTQ